MTSELTCYRFQCPGTLEGCDDPEVLFRCSECGSEMQQAGVEELAEDDGALAQLAEELLERA